MIQGADVKKVYRVVFLEGMIVLGTQVLSAINISPFFGNTYYHWLYGLVLSMTGLGVGYALVPLLLRIFGDTEKVLKLSVTTLVLYLSFMLALKGPLLFGLLDAVSEPLTGTLISLIVLFFVPVTFAAVIPILSIKLLEAAEGNEGVRASRVFSISSLGGAFGVLCVTYFVLPFTGAVGANIFLILLLMLLFLTVMSLVTAKKMKWLVLGAGVIAVVLSLSNQKAKEESFKNGVVVLYEDDGVLGKLTVLDIRQSQTRYLLVNNNIQSQVHFTGRSLNPYVYATSMYTSWNEKGADVLVAGLGSGSLAYELGELGYKVDVVDIDARLHDIVQEHFLVSENNYTFIHSDVRRYLKQGVKKYNTVIVDISHGENVPSNVFTVEGFTELKQMLKKDGLVLIHFLSSQDAQGKHALSSLVKTMNAAGFNTKIMNFLNRKELFPEGAQGNPEGFVIAASTGDLDLKEKEFVVDESLMKELIPDKQNLCWSTDNLTGGIVFTDNCSSLNEIHANAALKYRKISIEQMKSLYN